MKLTDGNAWVETSGVFFVRLLGWSNARKKITQGPPLMQWVKYCDSPNILTLWIVHIYAIYFPVCLSLVCWWGNGSQQNGRWFGLGYPAHMTCSQAEFSHSTHANVLSNILNIVDTLISVHLQSQAGCFTVKDILILETFSPIICEDWLRLA